MLQSSPTQSGPRLDFCADQGTLRLVYFHPFGLVMYPQAFREWLAHSRALTEAGRLRWTTMDQYSRFANRRLHTVWSVRAEGSQWLLQARHHRPALGADHAPVDRADRRQPGEGAGGERLIGAIHIR